MGGSILAAGGGVDPLVRDIGLCLLTGGVLCVVFARLRIPSIAAFLAAGVVLGPHIGPQLVTDEKNIATIANLGLVLLLFLIGLEIDLRKLLSSGRVLLVAGALQFPLCVALGYGTAHGLAALGLERLGGGYLPLYVGFTVAASSTLLVVRLLQEKGQMDTVAGRLSVGILIFQDIWAIVVLAVQPNFENPSLAPVLYTFLGIAVLGALAAAAARWVLPAAFRWIAKTPELILVAATGWCFGIGILGNSLGHLLEYAGLHLPIAVSMEMGALLAGATLASLPYATAVVSKVGVVHDFFITLFFVGLGMQIPAPESATVLALAAALAAVAVIARYAVFFPLLYFNGLDRRTSLEVSTKLAQVSEFCLVIAYLGSSFGHLDSGFVSAVIFAFVATALASPALFALGDRIHEHLGGFLDFVGIREPDRAASPAADHHAESADVVILGVHRVASSLLYEIERHHPDLRSRILVVDFNVTLHEEIARRGFRVQYGDFSSAETLHHAGVGEARVVLCTIPDDLLKGTTNRKIVRLVRSINPDATLIVNSITTTGVKELYDEGADYVYFQRVETALNLVPAVKAALEGTLPQYRRAWEKVHGSPFRRSEVLP